MGWSLYTPRESSGKHLAHVLLPMPAFSFAILPFASCLIHLFDVNWCMRWETEEINYVNWINSWWQCKKKKNVCLVKEKGNREYLCCFAHISRKATGKEGSNRLFSVFGWSPANFFDYRMVPVHYSLAISSPPSFKTGVKISRVPADFCKNLKSSGLRPHTLAIRQWRDSN